MRAVLGAALRAHDAVVAFLADPRDLSRRDHLDVEALRLLHEPLAEIAAGESRGKARVIVEPLSERGLAAERGSLEHERRHAFARRVERRRESRGTAADHDEVVEAVL